MSAAILVNSSDTIFTPGCLPTEGTSDELTTSVEPFRSSGQNALYDGSFMATTIVASSTIGEPICRCPILTWQWAVPPRTSAP